MADDTTPSASVLSTPQATANLDDVLASLEKQVTPPEVAPNTPIVTTPQAPTTTPETSPSVASFQIEESPIQSSPVLSAPVAESLPTADHVQDHPSMEIATSTPTATPTPKPSFFSRFSFNPKFAIGALVVALIAIGAVGTYTSYFAPAGSLDTRKHACTWITTGCGSGCSDNKDLFNPACVGSGGVSNSTPPPGSDTRTCSNGWTKGTIGCIGADQYSCTINPDLLRIGCCPGAAGDSCRGTTTPGGGGTTPVSTTCGASGQACCDPFTNNGLICSNNLFCDTSTGKCQSTPPTNLCAVNGGTQNGMCEVYTCGTSCNLGNQCTLNKRIESCSTASLNGQCGQIDYLNDSGLYCGVKVQNCGGSCAGGPTNPPTTQPTSTPVPSCNSTCTSSANCPTGLTCSAGRCRNSACVTSTTCTCPSITPSPSPTASPSTPPLVCLTITKDVGTPVIGSQVRFTCGTVSGATAYEFRYKYTASGSASVGGSLNANQNISDPLVISTAAIYTAQCRPCVNAVCTEWEAW